MTGRRSERRRVTSELHLFRFVPGTTPAHRMWAGTKLLALAALGVSVAVRPTWPAEAVLAGVAGLYVATARLPAGVVPRLPRWLWIGVAIGLVVSALSGGRPNVHVGDLTVGLGGLLDWLRFTVLALLALTMSALIGWTTPAAEIAPAFDRLAGPARWLRLPVDEFVVAIGLSVRALPMLTEEFRTLRAAWRIRAPAPAPGVRGLRGRAREVGDLLAAALVSSVRRAREMAEAIEARGGPGRPVRPPLRLGAPDLVAALVVAAAVAAIALL